MLPSLPPETLGASLASATAGALLDVAGFLVFVVVVLAIITSCTTTTSRMPDAQHAQPSIQPAPKPAPKRISLRTAMKLLEVDLATVETFPALSTVQTATAAASPESSESAELVEALRSELPDETPNETPMTSSGSSLAVLDSVLDAWPPAPRRPGEKVYRYVLASGQLVRLRDLRMGMAAPPSRNMLN